MSKSTIFTERAAQLAPHLESKGNAGDPPAESTITDWRWRMRRHYEKSAADAALADNRSAGSSSDGLLAVGFAIVRRDQRVLVVLVLALSQAALVSAQRDDVSPASPELMPLLAAAQEQIAAGGFEAAGATLDSTLTLVIYRAAGRELNLCQRGGG